MACISCGASKALAKGLCSACYWRERRTGSVERTNVRNTGECSVDGCDKPSFAKNLCDTHYRRADHPMKAAWKIIRSRNPGAYPPGWDRFETFVKEVGERPSAKHQLRRIDPLAPYSVANVYWHAPLGLPRTTGEKEKQAAYTREWSLRNKFNITGEQRAEILAQQGGGCAICHSVHSHIGKDGVPRELAVDHDHKTGAVRGLLCMNCNQGVGRLQDSPELLRAAADYLDRHNG